MIWLKQSKDGQFYFVVKHKNGQTLVTSETYKRKHTAARIAARLTKSCTGILDGTGQRSKANK